MADQSERGDIATRFRPGTNSQDGTVHRRGPDRRPRRMLRRMLLVALASEGPITIEVEQPDGGYAEKTIRGKNAAAHQLLVAIQKIARMAEQNPMAVLRLLELLGEQIDGRPMPAGADTTQRSTTFVYETDGAVPPDSVANVVENEPPEDEGYERVDWGG